MNKMSLPDRPVTVPCYQVPIMSLTTFYKHQRNYVFPLILDTWRRQKQDTLNEALQDGDGLVLEGDARFRFKFYNEMF